MLTIIAPGSASIGLEPHSRVMHKVRQLDGQLVVRIFCLLILVFLFAGAPKVSGQVSYLLGRLKFQFVCLGTKILPMNTAGPGK